MTTKKMTKKEMFTQILTKLVDESEKAFIEHEIELLEKKNSRDRKPTSKQVENEELKTYLHLHMEDNTYYSISEISKKFFAKEELSNQKISALLRQMVESGSVKRVEEKRKPYFCKVSD